MNKIKNQKSKIKNTNQKSKFFPALGGIPLMRGNFALPFCFLIFGFCISCGYAQNAQEAASFIDSTPIISMDFKDVNLKDILKAFSIQSGLNFIASKDIKDYIVTLYLDKVSVGEAMDKLFRANNLEYEFYEEDKIILVKEAVEIETLTKVFPLKYHSVPSSNIKNEVNSYLGGTGGKGGGETGGKGGGETGGKGGAGGDILTSIKGILSKNGKITEDTRTNSLIITDVPTRFPLIEQILAQLDVPVPQVMLEVEILDVSKNVVDNLGFSLGTNPFTMIIPGHAGRLTRFFIGDLDDKAAGIDSTGVEGSLIFGSTFAALLDFLRTQTDTKYLARPRILTLDNETAEIKIETEEVVGRKREESGETGNITYSYEAEREKTGISLRVTPQINLETGEITMFISPSVKDATDSTILDELGQAYKNIEERGTKSIVKVKDGETVVLGGLIRHEFNETITKLPILGDIPIIGSFFRHKNKTKDEERELLVFITPRIIRDTSDQLAKDSSGILSSREQDITSEEARLLNIEATLDHLNATRSRY